MGEQQKRVTMYTIAAEVGMSIAAVSRAFDPDSRLKPEKRQLILDTAKRLGYVQNKMASRLSGEPMKIGVLIYGTIREYYEEYVAGIQSAHAAFADYKVDCDLQVLRTATHTPEDVCKILDNFLAEKVDGIIVSGLSKPIFVEYLNKFAAQKIPLILLNSDIPGVQRCCVSGSDTETAGRMAAQLLRCGIGMTGPVASRPVAILRASSENLSQLDLTTAFTQGAARYGLDLVAVRDTENRPEQAAALTDELVQLYPDLKGIYISSANSVPVCQKLKALGLDRTIALVTSDVFDALQEYLRDGTVFATIDQDPFHQAKAAFEALFYNISDSDPIPEFLRAKPQAVFDSNLHLFTRK
jgi:LacI family transcriptional regulator